MLNMGGIFFSKFFFPTVCIVVALGLVCLRYYNILILEICGRDNIVLASLLIITKLLVLGICIIEYVPLEILGLKILILILSGFI